MAEQDLDRNEAATPYKLQRARERGQAAKSTDVVGAIVFTVAAVYLTWRGFGAVATQFRFDQAVLIQAGRMDPSGAGLWPLTERALRAVFVLSAPFFATVMLAAVVGNMMQTGPMLSFDPVKMDFNRINPVNGLKRLFSMRVLFDTARALIKLTLLGLVSVLALKALLGQFYGLASLSPIGYLRTLLDDLSSVALKMALVLGLIALLDLMYTRREFAKKMRMSQRDIKDEAKHRDGDPRIRARLRELRRETLKRSLALRETRNADVLITNPTHFAVALKYDHGRMVSPQLLAKGSGHMAAAMREIAARHGIPVVQNPPLARRLYRELPVDQAVPPELYAQVARIIVWVFAMREQRQGLVAKGVQA
ncbi:MULTISPECIES: EscU/YscU/HrcU family type III secretion system export apparatus switch protein [Variovorax]|jgi:flagellar biosynthesis protein FlhB|uniref:EscU/YscU/HrcU family type III secretion system export apparatus switch protein n=1 Tax=Variovorax TaxID=34072 RepID=UPI00086F393C|nr:MULTISPECIES: EscU/YscU/HrcU family type III secretion system export apparatus switch protein [Variovorax]MBN8758317.1 EscU/YscU/HrcU family type III secretion system export apparatus switch protein [Variovorax sp.]ODU12692.1 MAG: type III secretion protein [Variovorax sp. SCN 67-85]ODV19276.1 MAG: type III secretion protein [Variovorax sp. SCN 67-20]OJZ06588.1 MAG: type III secretion protein [Variovorax sp. 67-131]UKI07637.1 EscU/YscU/HrcU family type III secretion system export apparatus 